MLGITSTWFSWVPQGPSYKYTKDLSLLSVCSLSRRHQCWSFVVKAHEWAPKTFSHFKSWSYALLAPPLQTMNHSLLNLCIASVALDRRSHKNTRKSLHPQPFFRGEKVMPWVIKEGVRFHQTQDPVLTTFLSDNTPSLSFCHVASRSPDARNWEMNKADKEPAPPGEQLTFCVRLISRTHRRRHKQIRSSLVMIRPLSKYLLVQNLGSEGELQNYDRQHKP